MSKSDTYHRIAMILIAGSPPDWRRLELEAELHDTWSSLETQGSAIDGRSIRIDVDDHVDELEALFRSLQRLTGELEGSSPAAWSKAKYVLFNTGEFNVEFGD